MPTDQSVPQRKIVQLIGYAAEGYGDALYALADDGTVWTRDRISSDDPVVPDRWGWKRVDITDITGVANV